MFKRGFNRLMIWAKKNTNYTRSRRISDHRAVAAALHHTRQMALTYSGAPVVPALPAHKRAMLEGILAAAEADRPASPTAVIEEAPIAADNNEEVDQLVALKRRDQLAVTGNRRVIDFRLYGHC